MLLRFTDFFNQLNDRADRILLTGIAHGIYICVSVLVKMIHCIKEGFPGDFFLFKYNTEALAFKGTGI